MTQPSTAWRGFTLLLLVLVLLAGIFLRVKSFEKLNAVGFDENLYGRYVKQINKVSIWHYPDIVDLYLGDQEAATIAFLPPTRIAFLWTAAAWQQVFKIPAIDSVRAVSCAASIALLLLSVAFAWRLGGLTTCLGVTTLMAFAPTQIHIAHLALIDGFFGFTAVLVIWGLWECLQQPGSRPWLFLYGASLALMVLTKENAAFVYLAVLGILGLNRWLKFGEIRLALWIATILGPLLATGLLVLCAGGISPLLEVFSLNVRKSYDLPYAILTGDGPWFRYLSDLLLVSPAVLIFAIGGMFLCDRKNKQSLFLISFLIISYLIMGNLRYGMNLRYANMWDFPLRWLAMAPILSWSSSLATPARRRTFLAIALVLLSIFEFGNYVRIFVVHEVYDPLPSTLMPALDMIKLR